MSWLNRWPVATTLMLGSLSASHAYAGAIVTYDTSLVALPTQGFAPVNLSAAPLGSSGPFQTGQETVSFVNVAADQGIVQGSSSGLYAAPVTDAQGTQYGGKYFSTGDTGYIDITFASAQLSLALLWGSVDTSNLITFLSNGQVIGTLTGQQIDAGANGYQGFGGSFYTLINLSQSFNEIELSSGIVSFEGAELEVDQNNFFLPEPASLAVLGAGLLGLAVVRRRQA